MILVTGGTGFLGRHLVLGLLKAGEQVRILARGADAGLSEAGAQLITGGVLDPEALAEATAGVREIYHLAGQVSRDPAHARLLHQVHVEGTRALLEAAHAAGARRVVVASSSGTVAVSRDPGALLDEEAPEPLELLARWPYYLSKRYQERAALELGGRLGLEVVIANPSLLLGPGDLRLSSSQDVLRVLHGDLPVIPPGGLSFVDVRDVAAFLPTLMAQGRPGARYLLGGANMPLQRFFERVAHIAEVPPPRLRLPGPAVVWGARALDRVGRWTGRRPAVDPVSAEMSACYWYLDDSRARTELGWESRDPYHTLADTVSDLRQRGLA